MEQPDVTVVVVAWNALPWLEQCLDSVRGRDVVVVDNGSTDETVAFVREHHPGVRVIQQENKGMGGGNNAGMRVAAGRYFFLLNSDAWVLDDGLDVALEQVALDLGGEAAVDVDAHAAAAVVPALEHDVLASSSALHCESEISSSRVESTRASSSARASPSR